MSRTFQERRRDLEKIHDAEYALTSDLQRMAQAAREAGAEDVARWNFTSAEVALGRALTARVGLLILDRLEELLAPPRVGLEPGDN